MESKDNETDQIEAREAWDEDDEVLELSIKKPLDKVVPVRLASDKWEGLRREARELGIAPPPSRACGFSKKLRDSKARQRTA